MARPCFIELSVFLCLRYCAAVCLYVCEQCNPISINTHASGTARLQVSSTHTFAHTYPHSHQRERWWTKNVQKKKKKNSLCWFTKNALKIWRTFFNFCWMKIIFSPIVVSFWTFVSWPEGVVHPIHRCILAVVESESGFSLSDFWSKLKVIFGLQKAEQLGFS